jgi:hypothetical protein
MAGHNNSNSVSAYEQDSDYFTYLQIMINSSSAHMLADYVIIALFHLVDKVSLASV